MSDTFFDKIKRTVIEGASTSAAKIEDAARMGKVKLDLMAEENRLRDKYAALGERAFQALQASDLNQLGETPATVELVGAIAENLQRIQDLKQKIAPSSRPTEA